MINDNNKTFSAANPDELRHHSMVTGIIEQLRHYLPAQAPLKDFIHHNTLHSFQKLAFHDALNHASVMLGYKTYLTLGEYRGLFDKNIIKPFVFDRVLEERFDVMQQNEWKERLLNKRYKDEKLPRIGSLRAGWKRYYQIDLDSQVHPVLFRILCSYLDQGISIWNFPASRHGLLSSIRELEKNSFASFFKTETAKTLLFKNGIKIDDLLERIVGDPAMFKQYLFDQQFAHQGWSGIVSTVETEPYTLIERKHITLKDLIFLELLLEIDALEARKGSAWVPLARIIGEKPHDLFAPVEPSEQHQVLALWQEIFEWSYYDEVLAALKCHHHDITGAFKKSFQAMFCIDDRECSLRRYLEHTDQFCETFGTPGFFGVEFYFKPEESKSYTKLCPAPVTPKHLIKAVAGRDGHKKDPHLHKSTHHLVSGWLITQTLGFWSAFKLFLNIFKPSVSPATATSFNHMDEISKLTVEYNGHHHHELQIGFTVEEMAIRVSNLLNSIGLIRDFAPIIYVIGHGASSVNNPHYAAYDCGACSGRPGSVNARVLSFMANHPTVRAILAASGVPIPETTWFVGGLHDTTRDEIVFYDEDQLSPEHKDLHLNNVKVFNEALLLNAKERSRRFESIDQKDPLQQIHREIKKRSVSLFEPMPELNHATNALCIIGRRALTRDLFLDRRSFLNSYNYETDPEGNYLLNILRAAAPVCGGINLEYYFSRVDNHKLGAGTKLPHNVMGLIGVANGIDGDLRPGLPSQMVEVHDPVRLMIVVEHYPAVVLKTIQAHLQTFEWFSNEWIHLIALDPKTRKLHRFVADQFKEYTPLTGVVRNTEDAINLIATAENIPVHLINCV